MDLKIFRMYHIHIPKLGQPHYIVEQNLVANAMAMKALGVYTLDVLRGTLKMIGSLWL